MSQQFAGPTGLTIDVPASTVVSWSLVSQSAVPQAMLIKDPSGKVIVNTSVLSTNLSNTSSGSFPVSSGGTYTVLFPADKLVIYDSSTLNNGRAVISESYLFGGEDATDKDFNDAFAVLTWFGKTG